jgi:precorrin-6Y C5,15-methyltransferase (decarboxylating)
MKRVTVIGCGPGNPALLTMRAGEALKNAGLVIGSERLIADFAPLYTGERTACYRPDDIARLIRESPHMDICVLMGGDVGFYSGAKKLYPLLDNMETETICGISSVQYLAAKLCRSWQNMRLVSAHGIPCDAVCDVLSSPETFFLTGGAVTPAIICRQLFESGMQGLHVTVGERLSFPDERLVSGTPVELMGMDFHAFSVVLVDNPAATDRFVTHGLSDDAFIRGDAPMTKREIRSVALSMLEIDASDILYDIGAGTGSVAVEMAYQARKGRVYAIERDESTFALLNRNREKHGAFNIAGIHGTAPEALEPLPAPNAAFIGGSGGGMPEILDLLMQKNPEVRLVLTAVTLETLTQALATLEKLGYETQTVQIAASRAEKVGAYHMMKAQNPVFIIAGRPKDA